MTSLNTNLVVTGQPIQTIFGQYLTGKIRVNRKYQRKLVWTTEEKAQFIDSLLRDLPVPIILTAELSDSDGSRIEIIDGLQRLNAVFSFIEGAFPVEGKYFDPETLAETKRLTETGKLPTHDSLLDRDSCIKLSAYTLPVSTYRASKQSDVEEVFRRINSNGRHLSRQEIRQAGATTDLATLVRRASSAIRSDYSVEDSIDLRVMPNISLSDTQDGAGVFIDDLFWVRHGILDKDQVRTSRDEEVVLDILISMVEGKLSAYRSELFDEYYGLTEKTERQSKFEALLRIETVDSLEARIIHVVEIFDKIFSPEIAPFSAHFFDKKRQRVPRYFESVILAIDSLLFEDKREFIDFLGARESLKGFGTNFLNIPGGSGTWSAESKETNVSVVKGILQKHTQPSSGHNDPLLERTSTEVRNLLQASTVEAALFELKQGFCILSDPPKKNPNIIVEIAQTLSAMANIRPNVKGYLLVGISDTSKDSDRVDSLLRTQSPQIHGRYVTGLDLDTKLHGELDNVILWFTSIFKSIDMTEEFRDQILQDMRVTELDGKSVLLLKAVGQRQPVSVNEKYYERHMSQTVEVPNSKFGTLYARFSSGNSEGS